MSNVLNFLLIRVLKSFYYNDNIIFNYLKDCDTLLTAKFWITYYN